MTPPLAILLGRLAAEGLRLERRGEQIAVIPKARLTPDLQDEILRHRADVLELLEIHGASLLDLFRDPPPWPVPSGRTGPLSIDWWDLVGGPVVLRDGRSGWLHSLMYDTRTGRVRCYVDQGQGKGALLDPEDVFPAAAGDARRKESL